MALSLTVVKKKRAYIKGTHVPSGKTFNILLGDSNHASAELIFEGDRDTFHFDREVLRDPIVLGKSVKRTRVESVFLKTQMLQTITVKCDYLEDFVAKFPFNGFMEGAHVNGLIYVGTEPFIKGETYKVSCYIERIRDNFYIKRVHSIEKQDKELMDFIKGKGNPLASSKSVNLQI